MQTAMTDSPTLIARQVARNVRRSIDGAPDDAPVRARAKTLRTICGHLETLADEAGDCGCMGRPIDGFRLWVPQARLDEEVARADRLAGENAALREALSQIAGEDDAVAEDWMDTLIGDASERCRRWQATARQVLQICTPS